MDTMDEAQALDERLRDAALAEHRASHPRPTAALARPDCCDDCGDPIPEARRAAVPGCRRCAECQTLAERSSRR